MSLTFDLGHLNDLNVDVKEALKSSIFVVQKAAAPKTGLSTSYEAWRRCAMSLTFDQSEAEKLSQTHRNRHRINILSGPALRAAPAKMNKINSRILFSSFVNVSLVFILRQITTEAVKEGTGERV